MLNEEEIRAAIVQTVKPIAKSSRHHDVVGGPTHRILWIIHGLAWSLLGKEPPPLGGDSTPALVHFLKNVCGIPCLYFGKGSHSEILWDAAWMKAHGLTED